MQHKWGLNRLTKNMLGFKIQTCGFNFENGELGFHQMDIISENAGAKPAPQKLRI